MIDLAIRGGTVVSSEREVRADVGITGERIAQVGEVGPARSDIDARGKLLLPMLYSEGVARGRITACRLVDLLCATPARLAGLAPRKGAIAVGADADVVVLDPALTKTVRSADLRSNADHDPFDGWEVTGWPVLTISRGAVVARDGEVVGRAGHGRFLPRAPFRR